ncbi:hypothetical protein OAG71_01690 [bacterium]|nr:hypothetical protein [bacterium]
MKSSTSALGAMPQELVAPYSEKQRNSNPHQSPVVEVERFDYENVRESDMSDNNLATRESFSDVREDKWALNDADRMTEEEISKELFGEDDPRSQSRPISSNVAWKSRESYSSTDDRSHTHNVGDANRDNLAPRQTIESYLKNINSLTIDTHTPPSTSREGIDVPLRIVPPVMSAGYRNYPVTSIRYQTPDIYHNPLYFEDRAAERGGVIRGLRQPLVSTRKFAGDVLKLPIKIHNVRPRSCEYHQNLRYSQPSLIRN